MAFGSKFELDIGSEHRGVAVIIGNSYTRKVVGTQRQLPPLPNGPMEDTQSMKEAFDYLKFFTMVKHDLTQDELISLSHFMANYPLPKSCQRFVLTFSGHGGDGFINSEDEKRVNTNDVVTAFTPPNCNNYLVNIPRLFFFDTCRGSLVDPGYIPRGGDERWQSKVPSTGDILVAYATTPGYKAFEGTDGGFWTTILAKKLVSSHNSIYDVLTEVNRELIDKIRIMQGPGFQQPELLGRLNTTVRLLQESGQPQKLLPEDKNVRSSVDLPLALAQSPPGKDFSKSPKNRLQELCQSMRFSLPKYQNQMSESGFVVVIVSITIEEQEVCYRYTSEHTTSFTKKVIKQCEENAAEVAFKALTELYGTCLSNIPAQANIPAQQTTHEQSDKPTPHPSTMPELQNTHTSENGSPSKKYKSQLNEQFQEYGITDVKYDSTDDVTDGNVHNFTATLTYTVHGRKYRYESRGVFGRKQDAEEDTAQQALCEIGQQQRQFVSRGPVTANHYKQLLKERHCDKQQLSPPQYTTESTSGGFVSTVNVPQYKPVRGPVGNSKKEAEQLAAMEALKRLKI